MQALVSLERLDKYLWSNELQQGAVTKLPSHTTSLAVRVEDASFNWDPESEVPTLRNIELKLTRGALITVVGKVGSGKSSLLASLLGEMSKLTGKVTPLLSCLSLKFQSLCIWQLSGRLWRLERYQETKLILNGTEILKVQVEISGSTAYVAQTSWIQNGTIEENILFGCPMERKKYEEAIQRCALEQDLAQMEFGDQTEIGERGINLSGGQKQRIQLARALYQDCDIYLLDDIFSAVDAHTGSHIFQVCRTL